ncbi:MAG: substrate-binding domain-containing protein [Victivallales bacterium]|nr:substrate-binding domain-containing protein [Victivallales bacterium]
MSKSSVLENKCDVDGIILSSFGSDEILRLEREYHHDTPLLFLNRYSLREDFAYLAVNYTDFSRRIVSRLLKNGVRRIAVVGCGESEDLGYAEYTRTQGWKRAYEDETGSYPKELMFSKNVALNMSEYTEFLRNDRPEVVYVLTGGELPVAWAGLVQAGLTPGKDVDVVCFDDVEEFGLRFHPVSFVRMPLVLMASKAVDYFAHRDKMKVPKEFVEPQLIVEDCRYLL